MRLSRVSAEDSGHRSRKDPGWEKQEISREVRQRPMRLFGAKEYQSSCVGNAVSLLGQDIRDVTSPVRWLCVHLPDTAFPPRGFPPLKGPCAGTLVPGIASHRSALYTPFLGRELLYS